MARQPDPKERPQIANPARLPGHQHARYRESWHAKIIYGTEISSPRYSRTRVRKTHKKLTRTAPKGTQMAFWEQGLEEIQGHLDEVQLLLDECERLVEAQKKAEAHGLGRPEAKSDKLPEALKRLDDAIELANEKTAAARSSLEMTDQDFSAGSRSRDFVKAAGQLKELAFFCEATAVQLKGTAALMRQASAAQAQDSHS